METICTYTGKAFCLENIKPENICIEDIAHGLSMLCRYNGQCNKFYSVAEHCVLLSRIKYMSGAPLARLLHDAAEAYIGDVAKPLKNLLPQYKTLEHNIQKVIAEKYQVDFEEVKAGDIMMLEIEASSIMHDEFFNIHNGNSSYTLRPRTESSIEIIGWSPEIAEKEFLMRAAVLGIAK